MNNNGDNYIYCPSLVGHPVKEKINHLASYGFLIFSGRDVGQFELGPTDEETLERKATLDQELIGTDDDTIRLAFGPDSEDANQSTGSDGEAPVEVLSVRQLTRHANPSKPSTYEFMHDLFRLQLKYQVDVHEFTNHPQEPSSSGPEFF